MVDEIIKELEFYFLKPLSKEKIIKRYIALNNSRFGYKTKEYKAINKYLTKYGKQSDWDEIAESYLKKNHINGR